MVCGSSDSISARSLRRFEGGARSEIAWVGINSPSYRNFRSAAGEPAEPTSISFTTKQ
jgi:hypothetical protein